MLNGGIPLRGEVSISGAKNAVVAILPATILAQDVCVIENIPNISDVYYMTKILEQLGARIKRLSKSTLEIDTKGVNSYVVSHDMTKHLRASYYFIGALLGRFHRAKVAMPGGCNFGVRPIDRHIKGFELLGSTVTIGESDNRRRRREARRQLRLFRRGFCRRDGQCYPRRSQGERTDRY